MISVTLTIDQEGIRSGFLPVTKVDENGTRKGKMPLRQIVKLMQGLTRVHLEGTEVRLYSRFTTGNYLGIGNNGPKWVAVKEIPPAEYFLTTVTGQAYKVQLPRLIARVSNLGSSYLFWTEDEALTPNSLIYPLIIGNIDARGWICLGTTRLKCEKPEDIDRFIRQAIEAPTTGTYLPSGIKVEEFYHSLTERWDKSVGAKFGITLERLISATE